MTATPSSPERDHRHRRALRVTIVFVLILAFAAQVTVLTWWNELPDPLATHFSVSGAADGWTALGTVGLLSALGLLTAAVFPLLMAYEAAPSYTVGSRFSYALAVALTAMVALLDVVTAAAQRGVSDARLAVVPGWAVLSSLLAAIAIGWLWYLLLPRPSVVTGADPGLAARPVELETGQRCVWTRTVSAGPALIGSLGIGMAVCLVAGALTGEYGALVMAPVLAVTALMMFSYRVTVDARGVSWRSRLGVPRGHVPLADISAVEAVEVEPTRFLGWGLRVMPGEGVAIVLGRGPGLRVVRMSGPTLTITVDDPQTAAGLLRAMGRSMGSAVGQ